MPRFAAARAALLPAFADRDTAQLQHTLDEGGAPLKSLIVGQQLAPLWHARTRTPDLAQHHMNSAMVYLRQRAAQLEIDGLFTERGLTGAIFKGAAIRELAYDDPALRICCDIDILVAPEQRVEAARALVEAGYRLSLEPSIVSHEVTLTKDSVAIDLHWGLLRPGRTPETLTAQMLARRERHQDRWILSGTDAVFVMLVHPAFSKHLSTSQMGLHRLVDIILWLQRREVNWPELYDRLEACGLKTAAWTILSLVRLLSPTSPTDFDATLSSAIESLRPGRLRAAYLKSWLTGDYSARLTNLHSARLLGLSLWLHDQPADAWRALRGWQRSRMTRDTDSLSFAGLER